MSLAVPSLELGDVGVHDLVEVEAHLVHEQGEVPEHVAHLQQELGLVEVLAVEQVLLDHLADLAGLAAEAHGRQGEAFVRLPHGAGFLDEDRIVVVVELNVLGEVLVVAVPVHVRVGGWNVLHDAFLRAM